MSEYLDHARRHLPGGSDPLPGGNSFSYIRTSDQTVSQVGPVYVTFETEEYNVGAAVSTSDHIAFTLNTGLWLLGWQLEWKHDTDSNPLPAKLAGALLYGGIFIPGSEQDGWEPIDNRLGGFRSADLCLTGTALLQHSDTAIPLRLQALNKSTYSRVLTHIVVGQRLWGVSLGPAAA